MNGIDDHRGRCARGCDAGAHRLAACGSGSGSGGGGGGGDGFKIGIKFDQPGLGLKEGAKYTGFDVDVAKYVAKELGHEDSDIQFVEAPVARSARR